MNDEFADCSPSYKASNLAGRAAVTEAINTMTNTTKADRRRELDRRLDKLRSEWPTTDARRLLATAAGGWKQYYQ